MRTVPRPRPQLLVDPDRMVGRREELAELRRRLTGQARLVTVTGIGGCGKTTLVRTAALDLARTFKDAVWSVDVTEVAESELLVAAVGRELGAQVATGRWDASDLAGVIADRRGVLVLDGCDEQLAGCAALVDVLLRRCPELRVLATGRQPLRVVGEAVLVLEPLSHPGDESVQTAERAAAYDAVQLFVAKAATVVPSFRLTDQNAADVAAICAHVEGLPLAVELAAARVAVLSPADILGRLRDPYRLLTKGAKGAPERQRSLRASVEASHAACTEQEREMWARMSVLAGGFDLETVESVCAGEGIDDLEVLDLVDALLEKSVLAREETSAGRVRYRMLESLRTYGLEQLADTAEHWRERHAQHWADVSLDFERSWFGPDQPAWRARLAADRAGLDEVLEHGLETGRTDLVATVVSRLEPWWVVSGTVTEARHWLDRALDGDPAVAGVAPLATAAWFAVLQLDTGVAKELLHHAVELSGADPLSSRLRLAEGGVAVFHGDRERAVGLLTDAVDLAAAEGDLQTEAAAWTLLGLTHGLAGDGRSALEADQRALDMCTAAGDLHLRSYAAAMLGLTLLDRGDVTTADRELRAALEMKSALDDRFASAFLLEALAWSAAAMQEADRAATLLAAGAEAWRMLGLSLEEVPYLEQRRRRGEEGIRDLAPARVLRESSDRGRRLSWAAAVRYGVEGALDEAGPVRTQEDDAEAAGLTPREQEVAELIGQGLSNRAIAEALVVSQRTAQGHVENILRKLGFTSRTQVAAWVAERHARSD